MSSHCFLAGICPALGFPRLLPALLGTNLNKPTELNHWGTSEVWCNVWPSESVFGFCSFSLPCSPALGMQVCSVEGSDGVLPQKPWVGRGWHSPVVCGGEWKGTDHAQKRREGGKNGSSKKSKVALITKCNAVLFHHPWCSVVLRCKTGPVMLPQPQSSMTL